MRWLQVFTLFLLVGLETRADDFPDKPELRASVGVTSRYEYNVFYDNSRAVSDGVLAVVPKVEGHLKPSSFFGSLEAGGLFEQYVQNTVQNHFDYEGRGKLYINDADPTSFSVGGHYKSCSDLAPNEKYLRLPRSLVEGIVNSKIKGQSGNALEMELHYAMDGFTNPLITATSTTDPSYLSNSTLEGRAQYNIAFLPETSLFTRGSTGQTSYSSTGVSLSNNTLVSRKLSSQYYFGEAGFFGRLTEKSTIDFASGYLLRSYQLDKREIRPSESFGGPVFYLRFTEQVTKRDQLLAGYNYLVKDSYVTNYVLDQEIYLGLARIIGDQVLALIRVGYGYLSYSLPNRRDDERIAGALVIKYSLSRSIKLIAETKLDLLSSDGYINTSSSDPSNPDGTVPYPDRPSSYKAGSFGIGMVADF